MDWRLTSLFCVYVCVCSELVRTYLPRETASARGDWRDVTFKDALDMCTGNYQSSSYQTDEDRHTLAFFEAETYAGKADASFSWPSRVPPGTKHIYHTTDTFVVVRAMQEYVKANISPQADIWELVVNDILKPLNVQSGAWTSLRTFGAIGQPYGGYGLFWLADDVAKITDFVLNAGGTINGEEILEAISLGKAMQRDPSDRGLDVDKPGVTAFYHYGFWAERYAGADVGCPSQHYYQPYFSGL